MQIMMQDGEYWWGGIVDIGAQMPWNGESVCTVDPGTMGSDQRSPVFLSNKGRCIWSENPFVLKFNRGVIETDKDVYLDAGAAGLKGAHTIAAQRTFAGTGIPDRRFFEVPQYNTWIELMYNQNQKQILEYAHAIVDNGMKPGILMIDEGWSEDYGVFDFYPGRFENPKAMMEELHSLGFSVMLWVTPHISPDSNAFRELRNTDILLRDQHGKFAIREWWNGFSCVLDLSNPSAVSWFHEKLRALQEKYHVDGFKFDAGDPTMYQAGDLSSQKRVPLDCTADYAEFASGYPFNELRAVWNMGGRPLVCRLQDKLHTWDKNKGLGTLIPNMIAQGLLGYYYGCPDMIGGGDYSSFLGDGKLDEELYIRWLEVSLLCPMIQFSIAPWRILSEQNYQIVKDLIAFRERYTPYILELAENAAQKHEPILRPLAYAFPDQGFETEQGMYMLGSKYLIVPMLEKGGTSRTVTLPKGVWLDHDGTEYRGGEAIELEFPLGKVYVLEKRK